MQAPEQLILDLLGSLEAGPRSYSDIMEAWRTSCPRLPIWEDSVDLGLVRREGHMVMLTDAGRRRLGSGA
jgi:hypothetical protein